MPKRTPKPCNEADCGVIYPKCGTINAYRYHGCRCDSCYEAKREVDRKYRADNADKVRAGKRRHYLENREKVLDECRKYREANRDKVIARKRKDYEQNRDDRLAAMRRSHKANRESRCRQSRQRYYANRKEILAANKANRLANLEEHRKKARERSRKSGNARRAAQLRRVLVQAAWVEDVDPMVVFDRDGWICQHCGIECPKDSIWPALDSATLDHIIPLAWGVFRGAFHSYANTQTLCNSCNCTKRHYRSG